MYSDSGFRADGMYAAHIKIPDSNPFIKSDRNLSFENEIKQESCLTSLPQPLLPGQNQRDTEWLKVEVCREFLRSVCERSEAQCKFAHPSKSISIEAGKVVACFDSLKGKCHRDQCKYLHPPPHIKNQLEINGRNAQIQRKLSVSMNIYPQLTAATAQLAPQPQPIQPVLGVSSPALMLVNSQTSMDNSPKNRPDRLEICRDHIQRRNCSRGEDKCRYAHPPLHDLNESMVDPNDSSAIIVCMDHVKGRCSRDRCKYFHAPSHLIAQIKLRQNSQSLSPLSVPISAPSQIQEDFKPNLLGHASTLASYQSNLSSMSSLPNMKLEPMNTQTQFASSIARGIEKMASRGSPSPGPSHSSSKWNNYSSSSNSFSMPLLFNVSPAYNQQFNSSMMPLQNLNNQASLFQSGNQHTPSHQSQQQQLSQMLSNSPFQSEQDTNQFQRTLFSSNVSPHHLLG
jgi:muscleblind protein